VQTGVKSSCDNVWGPKKGTWPAAYTADGADGAGWGPVAAAAVLDKHVGAVGRFVLGGR